MRERDRVRVVCFVYMCVVVCGRRDRDDELCCEAFLAKRASRKGWTSAGGVLFVKRDEAVVRVKAFSPFCVRGEVRVSE